MIKSTILKVFYNKKGEESGSEGIITTLIVILLAVVAFGLLVYWVWRIGHVSLPKK